jgi:hypothetical protein
VACLSDVFSRRRADANFSGTLDFNEWKNAMAALGTQFYQGQDIAMFRQIDKDGSGTISEREFCEYWVYSRGLYFYSKSKTSGRPQQPGYGAPAYGAAPGAPMPGAPMPGYGAAPAPGYGAAPYGAPMPGAPMPGAPMPGAPMVAPMPVAGAPMMAQTSSVFFALSTTVPSWSYWGTSPQEMGK